MRRNPPRPTTDQLTVFQVIFSVTFQQDDMNVSLTTSSARVGYSPPAGAGAAPSALEITKNVTSTPNSVIPMSLGGGNCVSNLAPPMGLEHQLFNSNIDSSGANNENSTYFVSRKNLPTTRNTTPYILAITEGAKNIIKVFDKELAKLKSPRTLFTHDE